MMKICKSVIAALAMFVLLVGLSGCMKKKARQNAPARKSMRR